MQANPLHEKEAAMDARVDGIYRALKGKINVDSLIPTCLEIAQELEGLVELKGKEKLELLQKVLRQAVKDSEKSPEEKEKILQTIDTVVPIAMQAAILASKSPVVAQVKTACMSCCVPKVKKCACKKGECKCKKVVTTAAPASDLPGNFV